MNVCMALVSSPLKAHEAMRGHIFYVSPFISDHYLPCYFPGFIPSLTVLCRNALCSLNSHFFLTTIWTPRNPWGLTFIGLEM